MTHCAACPRTTLDATEWIRIDHGGSRVAVCPLHFDEPFLTVMKKISGRGLGSGYFKGQPSNSVYRPEGIDG